MPIRRCLGSEIFDEIPCIISTVLVLDKNPLDRKSAGVLGVSLLGKLALSKEKKPQMLRLATTAAGRCPH